MKRLFAPMMVLVAMVLMPAVGSADEKAATPEQQFYDLMDEMTAAFKEADCKKSAEMISKIDTSKMATLSEQLKEKYPDGPTEEAKKKMGEMMPAMQGAMKACSSDADWMKAMEALGKAMK